MPGSDIHAPAAHPGQPTGNASETPGAFALINGVLEFEILAAQCQVHHHLVGQQSEIIGLRFAQIPRPVIHHAKRTEHFVFLRQQRRARVKANAVGVGDHRVAGEAVVEPDIRNNQQAGAANGVVTERDAAFGFLNIQAHRGFEPLAMPVHQGDRGNRAIAEHRRAPHNVVVFGFRGAVQNVVAGQAA